MKRLLVLVVLGACTSDIAGSEPPDAGIESPDAPMAKPGEMSVARAEEWVTAKLHYCQAPNHKADPDADCPSTCSRLDNPLWDPYRSDCSGFVSWAWNLPPPGRTTGDFAPFQTDITHAILATDLRPGDAVNNDTHIALFKEWVDKPTKATFIDEPGCSSSTPYAREFTATVMTSGNTVVVMYLGTFTAIRYDSAP
jgi:hypothetical protein